MVLGIVLAVWFSFVLSPSSKCIFYGMGSKLGHNILDVTEYNVLYSVLMLSTSTSTCICLKLRFIISRTDIAWLADFLHFWLHLRSLSIHTSKSFSISVSFRFTMSIPFHRMTIHIPLASNLHNFVGLLRIIKF